MTISASRRMQAVLHRRPALRLAGLLAPALAWLGVFYLVPLGFLLATAFFDTDSFTGRITYELSADNVVDVLTTPAYLLTALRTVAVAVGVTLLCVLLALPLAGYMALVARAARAAGAGGAGAHPALGVLPGQGVRLADPAGSRRARSDAGYGWVGVVLTLTYLWLPYMVLPVYAGIDSMRGCFLEAAADLGCPPVDDVPHRGGPDAGAGHRGRLGVHLLAVAGRLHHRAAGRRHQPDAGQPGVHQLLHRPAVRRRGGAAPAAGHGRLPADRSAAPAPWLDCDWRRL